jgi:hypothetical protein
MTFQTRKHINFKFKSWGLLAISLILPGLAIASVPNSVLANEQDGGLKPDLIPSQVFVQGGSVGIPDDTTPIQVQWSAANQGQGNSQTFKDKLQVFFVGKESNACPGTIPSTGNPVAESEVEQSPLAPGQVGQNQDVKVGPFEEGSYVFYVTTNSDKSESNESNFENNSNYNCIYIKRS